MELFDRVFVINLDSRPDRWHQIVLNLRQHGVRNYERVSAIKPTPDLVPTQRNWLETYHHLRQHGLNGTDTSVDYAIGCLGCKLSHMQVLRLALQRGYQRVLILEDDAELLPQAGATLQAALQELPPDWNLLYLMANHAKQPQPVSDHLVQVQCSATTGGYAVQRHFMTVLLEALQDDVEEIDVTYMKLQPVVPMLCVKPHVARQRPGYSDIRRQELDYSVLGT
jgi:GR25 family glycosyltransferase involved in LPS biosynthesis